MQLYEETLGTLRDICGKHLDIHEGIISLEGMKSSNKSHKLVIFDDLGEMKKV